MSRVELRDPGDLCVSRISELDTQMMTRRWFASKAIKWFDALIEIIGLMERKYNVLRHLVVEIRTLNLTCKIAKINKRSTMAGSNIKKI